MYPEEVSNYAKYLIRYGIGFNFIVIVRWLISFTVNLFLYIYV